LRIAFCKNHAICRLWFSATSKSVIAFLFAINLTFIDADHANAQTKSDSVSSAESLPSQSGPQRSPVTLDKATTEYEIWGGTSYDAPTFRQERGLKVPLLLCLRYGRVIYAGKSIALEYTIDAIPAAVVSLPPAVAGQTSRQNVYGVGIIPVGFKAVFNRQGRFKPFVGVSTGPIYFSKQVPVPGSARFNFLSRGNAGLQIRMGERRAISIGYDFGHISNAGIGRINSGFNTNYVFVGFSVFR
jgi:hypothetical protein